MCSALCPIAVELLLVLLPCDLHHAPFPHTKRAGQGSSRRCRTKAPKQAALLSQKLQKACPWLPKGHQPLMVLDSSQQSIPLPWQESRALGSEGTIAIPSSLGF